MSVSLPPTVKHAIRLFQGLSDGSPTWHRLRGAAGSAKAVVIDCDDPEVVTHAWLQDVHAEGVGSYLLGDVLDEDVPEPLICRSIERRHCEVEEPQVLAAPP